MLLGGQALLCTGILNDVSFLQVDVTVLDSSQAPSTAVETMQLGDIYQLMETLTVHVRHGSASLMCHSDIFQSFTRGIKEVTNLGL